MGRKRKSFWAQRNSWDIVKKNNEDNCCCPYYYYSQDDEKWKMCEGNEQNPGKYMYLFGLGARVVYEKMENIFH